MKKLSKMLIIHSQVIYVLYNLHVDLDGNGYLNWEISIILSRTIYRYYPKLLYYNRFSSMRFNNIQLCSDVKLILILSIFYCA